MGTQAPDGAKIAGRVWLNGRQIYREIHGRVDRPVVVLLHHGLGSTVSWEKQVPVLVQADLRVIVYDRWGYGRSDPRPGLDAPEFGEDRRDLVALLEAEGINRTMLVGHSDGGTIALYFAADHPEWTLKLVTVAAHVYVEAKMKTGMDNLKQVWETSDRFRTGLQRLHGRQTPAVFENWYRDWRRPYSLVWDLRPDLAAIRCPTLVIQGTEDEYALPQHARDLAAAIPGARLCLFPGANHQLPQEAPESFHQQLLPFLLAP